MTSPDTAPTNEQLQRFRQEGLQKILVSLGDPDRLGPDRVTPVVEYYLAEASNPDSQINRLPYNEETGVPSGGVMDMRHGDVLAVELVGKDFLREELGGLAITVGFRALAIMRDPDAAGMTSNLDEWIAYWKEA